MRTKALSVLSLLVVAMPLSACGTSDLEQTATPLVVRSRASAAPSQPTIVRERAAAPPPQAAVETPVLSAEVKTPSPVMSFKYAHEQIPLPQNQATDIEPQTDLLSSPPSDADCQNQSPDEFRLPSFKRTFNEAFEEVRDIYIRNVSKNIARKSNNNEDNPLYDIQVRYAINKLKSKEGVHTWQVVFFSDYVAYYHSGKSHLVQRSRITSLKPCQYMGTVSIGERKDSYVKSPFGDKTRFTFDYRQPETK